MQENSANIANIIASSPEDDAAIYSRFVAEKLRALPAEKKDRAMKEILNCIYQIQYD